MTKFVRVKIIIAVVVIAMVAIGGYQMYAHKHFETPIVKGPGVTSVAQLSDYFPPLKDTLMDTPVFFLEGQQPGANMLVFGGTHSDEVAATLTAMVLIENARPVTGNLFVIPMVNNSGTRTTRPGEGQPLFYEVPTEWGKVTMRMGSRATSQAEQWPDPEVYVHYPSKQMLADAESRNFNRVWPGRADGNLTQQVAYAVTELMRAENIDMAVDLHQGSTMFPVNNVIIAGESGMKIGAYASALLRSEEGIIRPLESAPQLYRGLFNREIEEFVPGTMPFLMEVPVPFCDLPTGPKTEELIITGKDPLLLKLSEMGRLYARYDENGWPLEATVGQHCSALLRLTEAWTRFTEDKPLLLEGIPTYAEMDANSLGYYFIDPDTVPAEQIVRN